MSQRTAKIPENAESLRHAWYEFMGIYRPENNYRTLFNKMRRIKPNETQEDTDLRIRRAEAAEQNWKWDLLSQIRENNFVAYGRDITAGISAPITIIPNSLFEEQDEYISIDWDHNHITAHGRKIIDIKIAPIAKTVTVEVRQKKIGRPSGKGIEDAIEHLISFDPDFVTLTREAQCDRVREHIFGKDVNHSSPPKNFKDGAIKKRLREILPS